MIDKESLKSFIEGKLKDTDTFLVDVTVSPDNDIVVEIDSPNGIDIDECTLLNAAIHGEFDQDKEDYSLEVGSAGLTSPLRVRKQFDINIGNPVEVWADGKKLKGVLTEEGEDTFTITCQEKVKEEGKKRPVMVDVAHTFPYEGSKVIPVIEF